MTESQFGYSGLTLNELRTLASSPQVGAMESMPQAFQSLASRVSEVADLLSHAQSDLPNWWKGPAAEQAAATLGRAAAEAREFQGSALAAATAVSRCAQVVAEQQHQMMSIPELPEPGVTDVIQRPATPMEALEAARQGAKYEAAREQGVQVVNGIAAQYVETRGHLAIIGTRDGGNFAAKSGKPNAEYIANQDSNRLQSVKSASPRTTESQRPDYGSTVVKPLESTAGTKANLFDEHAVPTEAAQHAFAEAHSSFFYAPPPRRSSDRPEGLRHEASSRFRVDANTASHRSVTTQPPPTQPWPATYELLPQKDIHQSSYSDPEIKDSRKPAIGPESESEAASGNNFASDPTPRKPKKSDTFNEEHSPWPRNARSRSDIVAENRPTALNEPASRRTEISVPGVEHNRSTNDSECDNPAMIPPFSGVGSVRRQRDDRSRRPDYLKERKSVWLPDTVAAPADGILTPEWFERA